MNLIKFICLMMVAMLLICFAIGCSNKGSEIQKTETDVGSTSESLPEDRKDLPIDDNDSASIEGENKTDIDNNNGESIEEFVQKTFENLKSPHYVSSEPVNNAVLSAAVTKVSIMFNFDLASNSKIEVTKNGSSVTAGATEVAGDKLSMIVPINGNDTGNYSVNYVACWPDKSCHEGAFGFSIKLP